MLKAHFFVRTFHFGFSARTSRGAMREKKSWFIKIWQENDQEVFGIGECGPLPGLSPEHLPGMEQQLNESIAKINHGRWSLDDFVDSNATLEHVWSGLVLHFGISFLHNHPSFAFAMETALLDLGNKGTRIIFNNSFTKGEPIPINGLVWMGGLDFMLQQVEVKIRDGFKCIKLKIGGMDFEKECDILQYIRRKYFRDGIVIRLDANGAFKPEDALYKIKQFAKFDVHSLEQPIKTGSSELSSLCQNSPIPIALDEELIGVKDRKAKEELLDRIKPAFIIVKPTLHGGFHGSEEWISVAEDRKIGWWITSAMESNIGLNAISQFTARFPITMPQGLGTGEIYTDNFPSPLRVKKGHISYNLKENWDLLENN